MFGNDVLPMLQELRSTWAGMLGTIAPSRPAPGLGWMQGMERAAMPSRSSSWLDSLFSNRAGGGMDNRPAFDLVAQYFGAPSIDRSTPAKLGVPAVQQMAMPARQAAPPAPSTPQVAAMRDAGDAQGIVRALAQANAVPDLIPLAIMMAESEGDPGAEGDWTGGRKGVGIPLSIGLFQLHERGMGAGMSREARMDPYTNASKAVPRIAQAYKTAVESGLRGEALVRAVYDMAINPGGGNAYQGDHVMDWYRRLGG
jgi:hypothetical protein